MQRVVTAMRMIGDFLLGLIVMCLWIAVIPFVFPWYLGKMWRVDTMSSWRKATGVVGGSYLEERLRENLNELVESTVPGSEEEN